MAGKAEGDLIQIHIYTFYIQVTFRILNTIFSNREKYILQLGQIQSICEARQSGNLWAAGEPEEDL